MNSSVHTDNKGIDILILYKGRAQELDGTAFAAEALYPIKFKQSGKTFLHYNGNNGFFFVNATKIYHFKVKNSEIKGYALCLGTVSKDFTINNMKKKLKGIVNFFSFDSNPIDTNDIIGNDII